MGIVRCIISGLLIGLLVPSWAHAQQTSAETDYQKAKEAYQNLQKDALKKKLRHHWQKVGQLFEQVANRYPKSNRAADAIFTAGRIYRELYQLSSRKEDIERSTQMFTQVVLQYRSSRLADDAQMNIALRWIEFERNAENARKELAFLVKQFPQSDLLPKAKRMLEDLGGPPAEEEVEPNPVSEQKQPPENAAPPAPKEEKPVLEQVRHWSNPGYTRISLYTRVKSSYRVGVVTAAESGGAPPRLFVDLKDTSLADDLAESILVGDGVVKRVRVAAREGGFVRVVVDLDQERAHRAFPMEHPARVVLDVGEGAIEQEKRATPPEQTSSADQAQRPDGGMEQKPPEPKPPESEPKAKTQPAQNALDGGTPPITEEKGSIEKIIEKSENYIRLPKLSQAPGVSLSMLAGLKVKRVVLDPGHGGSDPGAIGWRGSLEKDLALDISQRVATLLREKLALDVILTRNTDRTLPLEERTAIANTQNADLFISVHLNANRDRRYSGIETFYLDITDDRYSMRLAARENATCEKSISDLQFILADLALKSNVDDSIALSRSVQKTMVGTIKRSYNNVRDLGIKHALFYVLLGARMPAILLETSFISNKEEETRVRTVNYRQHLAEAICAGIENFIRDRENLLRPKP